jgi:hypothetical protein
MTTLTFLMTIHNICDGDKHPNFRHKYTIKDMLDAYTIASFGKETANITFFDLKKR